ncbi:hypothetical protein MTYP_02613 [Methylophilaceae bacterium]|nr:hypothetical protein MTYP_02613 [Methylophilaceae bacterium]
MLAALHALIYQVRIWMKKYKVVIYQEGMLGSLLLGASKVDPVRFSEFLNKNAAEGWRVITMEKDIRRMLLFWKREAYVVVMEMDR